MLECHIHIQVLTPGILNANLCGVKKFQLNT